MEIEEYQIELCDLPDDCIAEILKRVKTHVDRNDARLVCRFWQHLIDSDSTSERYLVDERTTRYCNDLTQWTQLEFRNFIPQFLNFNRKKISFRFVKVNLASTEHFWTEKGAHIIGLHFEDYCVDIPLEHIFSKCIRLREMCIRYPKDKIIDTLELLAAKEFRNSSLNRLTIMRPYEETTVEMAIRFSGLISKMFPRMRKVTLHNFERINGRYEELSKKFTQLKYELELDSEYCTVVFNSSSKTPICMRKVCPHYDTMSPFEYYKSLEEITYWNGSRTIRLSELENIFSQFPTIQKLSIQRGTLIDDLSKPIGNRIMDLRFLSCYAGSLPKSTVFLDTFQFLKTFHIRDVSHATFTDIVLNMRHLEDLNIENFTAGADRWEINNEHEVLVHENLKKLTIPLDFVSRTRTIYRFDNLLEIYVRPNEFPPKSQVQDQDVDKVWQRFQCPNLKRILYFEVITTTSKSDDFLWVKNVISMFPKLELFTFLQQYRSNADLITEDQESRLRQICPKLKIFSGCIFIEVIERHLALTTDIQR